MVIELPISLSLPSSLAGPVARPSSDVAAGIDARLPGEDQLRVK